MEMLTGTDDGLLGGFPDAIARFDDAGRLHDINIAVARALGFSQGDIVGRTIGELPLEGRLGPIDALERGVLRTLEEGQPNRLYATWTDEGGDRKIEVNYLPYQELEGSTVSVIGIARDVTEQETEARQLALLRFALDQVREAVFLTDETGRILFVNEESRRVLGYTRDELEKLSASDVDPDFPAERWPAHWKELQDRGAMTFETRHRTKSGRLFPVEVSANYFEYAGRALNLALARDITERKTAERRLAELAAIVEHADESIIGKNLDGVITSWNRGAEKTFGYHESEMLGRNIGVLVPPDRADELAHILAQLRAGQRIERLETIRIRKDGQAINMSLTIAPLRNAAGDVVAASTVGRDITTRKRAEEKVQQQLRELQHWHDVTLNREGRILELKREVNVLLARLGEPARYGSADT
jgi:PAS domain S-box-containing protein